MGATATLTPGTASGLDQARRTPVGRAHEPDLARFYSQALAPITPGAFDLDFTLLRTGAGAQLDLNDVVESASWTEDSGASTLTGTLALRRPDPEDRDSLPIGVGHLVRCRVYWGARWYELWTMRCEPPDVTVDDGTLSVALADDMVLLRRSRRDYVFRRSRATRPFYAHEIAAAVAHRNGIRVGALAKGSAPIHKLIRRHASAAEVIAAAYAAEHRHTARRFVMRMRDGRLEVFAFRRNPVLFLLGEQIVSAAISQVLPKNPATVLTGKAVLGKAKARKHLRHTVSDPRLRARLGYTRREQDFGRVTSLSELVDKTNRAYAKANRIDRTGTVTVPLLPFIRRGDGVRVNMPGEGLAGANAYVYVTGARHSVTPDSQTSEFDWTMDDPFLADQQRLEAAQRAKARAAKAKAVA